MSRFSSPALGVPTPPSDTRVCVSGVRRVVGMPVSTALLLHVRLEQVAASLDEPYPYRPLHVPEGLPVRVVVLLDHLEGPPPGEDVAADELAFDLVGFHTDEWLESFCDYAVAEFGAVQFAASCPPWSLRIVPAMRP